MSADDARRRSLRRSADGAGVDVVDQTRLPHALVWASLRTLADAARAIATMQVRGAPLIGVTAAYGLAMALRDDPSDAGLDRAAAVLVAQRPTAANLRWAVDAVRRVVAPLPPPRRPETAFAQADRLRAEDVEACRRIGVHGLALLREVAARKRRGERVNVLTHCNAGRLACVEWGTATAPVYHAFDEGVPVHVWVDETRPRNQGAALTAYELAAHGVPHTVVVDNAGGLLMRRGEVDLVLVGADRVTRRGDVVNKVGTYLKALAARDTGVPFYVAFPRSTVDWDTDDGDSVAIEERAASEVARVAGRGPGGDVVEVEVLAPGTPVRNPAFDVTPARLVTGLLTERGLAPASAEGLARLYPEQA